MLHWKYIVRKEANLEVASCFGVCDILYKSLKKLCKMFQMNYDFKFGFICKDCNKFAGVTLQYTLSTNCICKECQRSFQLTCDQLVWFMPPGGTEAQISTLQQAIHLNDDDTVRPSPNCAEVEMYYNKKPEMCDLITIVIPKIQAEWEDVAFSMRYDVAAVKAFKEDCHDCKKCCRKLFEDWLDSSRGVTPKTWSKLLGRIKAVNSLKAEDIVKELNSMFK